MQDHLQSLWKGSLRILVINLKPYFNAREFFLLIILPITHMSPFSLHTHSSKQTKRSGSDFSHVLFLLKVFRVYNDNEEGTS